MLLYIQATCIGRYLSLLLLLNSYYFFSSHSLLPLPPQSSDTHTPRSRAESFPGFFFFTAVVSPREDARCCGATAVGGTHHIIIIISQGATYNITTLTLQPRHLQVTCTHIYTRACIIIIYMYIPSAAEREQRFSARTRFGACIVSAAVAAT